MPISLLIVGQVNRAEAKPLAEWLVAALQPAGTKHFTDVSTALRDASTANWIPDLIVILQSWPDEFSSAEVASLFALAPLARLVVAYGAWCESDGRTRNLWPLAVRVPLSNAASRIEREWRLLHEADRVESLPASASREEIFAADHPPLEKISRPQTVLVVSSDSAYQHALAELLTAAGHTVVLAQSSNLKSQISNLIFDADPWTSSRTAELCSLCASHPAARLIALMSLPRPEDEMALRALGASVVLPKLGDQRRIVDAIESADHIIPASQPA